jgi:DNA primase
MSKRKSILDIIAEYDIELRNEGEVIRAYCPFHNDTGRPNLTIYPETDSFYCFACKESGNSIAFVSKMDGISYSDAKKKLAGEKIELEELREQIDGIGIHDEPTQLNDELNILVSKAIRKALKDYPQKTKEILQFSREFDEKLQLPIYYNEMQNLIKELHFFQKKLYN